MRVSSYLMIMVGMMFLFHIAGLTTTAGYILTELNIIDSPEDISNSAFILTVTAVFTAVAAGGIIIGTLTRTPPESYLLVTYATVLLYFIGDIVLILITTWNTGDAWVYYIIAPICLAVVIGYAHAVVSWWGGKTS